MNFKTYIPKISEIERAWHVIDANKKVLGRLATECANILRGKDKAYYTQHLDCGDFVIVINAEKVVLTGNNKLIQKMDYRHSGYPGGDTSIPYKKLMETNPEKAVRLAVKGMLQKNRLAGVQIRRLKIYKGGEHPHSAQLAEKKAEKIVQENQQQEIK